MDDEALKGQSLIALAVVSPAMLLTASRQFKLGAP